jgi:hypothetical protein
MRAIEQVRVGDRVLSRDERGSRTVARPVTRVFKRVAAAVLAVTLAATGPAARVDAGGMLAQAAPTSETITTTREHPFHLACPPQPGRDICGFIPAGELRIGDVVTAGDVIDPSGLVLTSANDANAGGLRVAALSRSHHATWDAAVARSHAGVD